MEQGFFAIGIYHSKNGINIGTLWRTAFIFGASFIFTICRKYKEQSSDTMKSYRHIPLFHFKDFDDFKLHLPYNCRIVGIEMDDRAKELKGYIHPERACYLLGAEDTGLPDSIINKCHDLIKLDGKYSMNVAVTGSVVIYHRVGLKNIEET